MNSDSNISMPLDEIFQLPSSDYISLEVKESIDTDDWSTILEEIGVKERTMEDAYDLALQKEIMEKFPHLYPLPPPPPIEELKNLEEVKDGNLYFNGINLGNGKFEYIEKYDREILENAWQAISQTNNWDFMAQDIDSFMFSNDPRINIIYRKMEELGYYGHSGCSFGWTMRNMQYLVNHGEEKFKELFKT